MNLLNINQLLFAFLAASPAMSLHLGLYRPEKYEMKLRCCDAELFLPLREELKSTFFNVDAKKVDHVYQTINKNCSHFNYNEPIKSTLNMLSKHEGHTFCKPDVHGKPMVLANTKVTYGRKNSIKSGNMTFAYQPGKGPEDLVWERYIVQDNKLVGYKTMNVSAEDKASSAENKASCATVTVTNTGTDESSCTAWGEPITARVTKTITHIHWYDRREATPTSMPTGHHGGN